MQLTKLTAVGPEPAVAAIEASIANGWTGVFPEREADCRRNGQRPDSGNVAAMQEWLRSRAGDGHVAE